LVKGDEVTHYTVIIPAFNAGKVIIETLESILRQSMTAQRIIVVDDGSSDNTVEVVLEFNNQVEVIRLPHAGSGFATTRGMQDLDTPYLAFCDADDLWLPEKAEHQLEYLAHRPDVSGACAMVLPFRDQDGHRMIQAPAPNWGRTTLFISTAAALSVGEFVDPPGGHGETIDWIARARLKNIQIDMIKHPLAMRRIWPQSTTWRRDRDKDIGYLHVVRNNILRNRAGKGNADWHRGE
jgi:glycosyltransferase involved in cell wall biosynthesis